MSTRFAFLLLLVIAGCSDEARIPQAVMDSPPAKSNFATENDYYPEQPDPTDKVAAAPPIQLTVDRPYESWTLPQTAADSLAKLGPAALPVLVPKLNSPDVAQRRQAAKILAHVGPDAAQSDNLSAVAAIVASVENLREDVQVRKDCARAIGQIGPALVAVRAPSPPVARATLEPLPNLTPAQLADPITVAARQREAARRQLEAERAQRDAERYARRLQDYRLRQQLAQRAAAALMSIAQQDAGGALAARD
jgi:hypothetical protein